jgi:nucleoside-diphosphate-sugar epimerase
MTRILLVGGAGYVGRMLLPPLIARHAVRVLDLRPPPEGVDHVIGSASDYDTVLRAVEGTGAVVHCAMGNLDRETPDSARQAFEVSVLSVHQTLRAAHDAGVPHAVYISSMSVYRDLFDGPLTEDVPTDATDVYGLTKRFGEEICRAATVEWGMSVNVLRLAFPTPDEMWPAWGKHGTAHRVRAVDGTPVDAISASDLGRAVLAALDHRNGYQVFTVCGDRRWSTDKARRQLGWAPSR